MLFAFGLKSAGHSHGRRDASGRVACTKSVVLTFRAAGKTRKAIELAQRGHFFTTAGQNFVGITLMTHIPNNPIIGGIKNIVQGNRQFNRTQIGGKMSAGF